ncbi:MAG: FAD:protein FMN transferase, partial [Coriobacteriia bacterium]|nr:FAD:protein FMN transferase [Coriobacteriia bacterium]
MHRITSTRLGTAILLALAAFVALTLAGCDRTPDPLMDSREALGTIVSVTAYPADGTDDQLVSAGSDLAFAEMARVEAALDVHDPTSAVAKINSSGEGTLPPEALEVLDSRDELGVTEAFSPFLLEVVRLYDFEGTGTVPPPGALKRTLVAANGWRRNGAHIRQGADSQRTFEDAFPAGLDFGGAAKGLALGDALGALEISAPVTAAIITAGSTTLTFGHKPNSEPWLIGIEDPRDPEATIATVEASGHVSVSTSGDYQRYFERNGVRYHHILDPRSGLPARGLRSLTVVGNHGGLESDILSTALFVMGPEKATSYAE